MKSIEDWINEGKADSKVAISKLKAAIAIHTKHMNGTIPSTGPAAKKSQEEEMELLKSALAALTGKTSKEMKGE